MTASSRGADEVAGWVREAAGRIGERVRRTPVEPSPRFEELAGRPVVVKLENLQHTGSFKVRGALNAVACMDRGALSRGVIAASTGNHGLAVAYAARQAGVDAIVYVPETAAATKLEAIRRLGAEIRSHGSDGVEAERRARLESETTGRVYVSPYNDWRVVAGQGTVGVELAEQVDTFDTLFLSIGGGGLATGVAGYLAERRPEVRVVGCSPSASAVMAASVRAGEILDLASAPTLSDGTAGGVEAGAVTFDPCREMIDEWVLVSEAEIRTAMVEFIGAHRQLVEGSAGVALAAFVASAARLDVGRAVVVVCGGNLSLATLREVLSAANGGAGEEVV